jgi:hypothetical protein
MGPRTDRQVPGNGNALGLQETILLLVPLLTTTALLCAPDSAHQRPSIVEHSEVQGKAPLILSELQLSRDSDSKRPSGSMIPNWP